MAKHESLIARLCEASEGSAELSAEVMSELYGHEYAAVYSADHGEYRVFLVECRGGNEDTYTLVHSCLTTSLSAAWEETKARGWMPCLDMLDDGNGFEVILWDADDIRAMMTGKHEACTIVAALLAAEGER